MRQSASNRYRQIIDYVFHKNYSTGDKRVSFERSELEEAAKSLGILCPKNLGDIIYTFRFRGSMPATVSAHAPEGEEWIIRGTGKGHYVFELVKEIKIRPNANMVITKIPDATPEIIRASALGDEQALLALVRYNRLIDTFLGVTSYSLQNHLRTTAQEIGQVEIDEVYVAIDRYGKQYVIPVQAKGGKDEIGVTQPEQDLAVCSEKWPLMKARSVAVQFMEDGVIALFELILQDGIIRVAREAHYKLVPNDNITDEDRAIYDHASSLAENIFEI